jgi:uncharacterized protein with HEPN domain
MKNDDRVRLEHMLEAAREAMSFAEGRVREDLNWDRMLLQAIVRNVEIVGEASVNVSREYRDEATGIPWPKLAGMRNRIVHAYFDIDPDIVWDTVTQDLPLLVEELANLLAHPGS